MRRKRLHRVAARDVLAGRPEAPNNLQKLVVGHHPGMTGVGELRDQLAGQRHPVAVELGVARLVHDGRNDERARARPARKSTADADEDGHKRRGQARRSP